MSVVLNRLSDNMREVFSRLLIKAQEEKDLHGLSIVRGSPNISHLFFVDDSLIFRRDSLQDA
ncbi:hypothetical protein MTR_3g063390 [Medicago truncatula]|uniref:Reverse transcriptase n=1 Tax=Medicago truncatula TaxID=3880 RepID=A0A072UYP8_MEDTR|nr:hypothetical protein MTR_3g063390 [Medicago truncatula]